MIKSVLIAIIMAFTMCGIAQSNVEEVDIMQAKFGKKKKKMITEYMTMNEVQADSFWVVYDEYEVERKALGRQRIVLMEEYLNTYKAMTAEEANIWTLKAIDLQKRRDSLIVVFYEKVKVACDGIVGTQFYQIENFVLNETRFKLLDELPFINEK